MTISARGTGVTMTSLPNEPKVATTLTGMPGRLLRLLYGRHHAHLLAVAVQRVWPLMLAGYLMMIVASPLDRPLYGFGATWVTTVFLIPTAAMLVLAAIAPQRETVTAAAMAMTTWSLMGRGASYAFSDDTDSWVRAIGSGAYAIMTFAVVLLYVVHATLVVEQRVRGDEAI